MHRLTRQQRNDVIAEVYFDWERRASWSPGATAEELLCKLGITDGKALGLELLRESVQSLDTYDVEIALFVCFTCGLTPTHLGPLLDLASAEWHNRHEDVVSALDELRTAEAIPALVRATQWVPEYLGFDESRALATKAIRALGNIPGSDAEQALISLADSDNDILSKTATTVLQYRDRTR